MSRQNLAIVAGAIVLFVVAVLGAMAFSSGGDSGGPTPTRPEGSTTMTMPDGSTMPMP